MRLDVKTSTIGGWPSDIIDIDEIGPQTRRPKPGEPAGGFFKIAPFDPGRKRECLILQMLAIAHHSQC